MAQTQPDPNRANPFVGVLSVSVLFSDKHLLLDGSHIVDCWFIEDIFTHVMFGKLSFYDMYNIQEKGPLLGNETVTLYYGGKTQRTLSFRIYDIKYLQTADVNPTSGGLIEISIVDTSYTTMIDRVYSRSFPKGQTYTTMIKSMLRDICSWSEASMKIDESSNESPEAFAIPYWSIAKTARFLLKRATSKMMNTSGYTLYNNTLDGFSVNVKTLNWLFSQFNEIDDVNYHFEAPTGESLAKGEYRANKILEWEIEGFSKSNTNAMYGGTWRGINTKKGTLDTIEYKFSDGVAETTLLGRRALFDDRSDTDRYKNCSGERNLVELKNYLYNEWVKTYSTQNKVSILVEGNEKRYAGHLINIEWPSYDSKYDIYQKQMQGLWLVRAITHSFSPNAPYKYIQKMVLIKNAFTYSESKSLIESTKTNLTGGKRTKFITAEET